MNKKNMLVGFAIFAAMLMLTLLCMARPMQERTTIDAVEQGTVNDSMENERGILTNEYPVDIKKIKDLLGYTPKVDFNQGMKNVEKWLKDEGYI